MQKNQKTIIIVFIASLCLLTCCSTTKRTGATDIISANSYTAGQLEATIRVLDETSRRLEDSIVDSQERINDIISTSDSITSTIGRIEYLFSEYEREVERIRNENIAARDYIESQKQSLIGSYNNTVSNDSSENSSNDTQD